MRFLSFMVLCFGFGFLLASLIVLGEEKGEQSDCKKRYRVSECVQVMLPVTNMKPKES